MVSVEFVTKVTGGEMLPNWRYSHWKCGHGPTYAAHAPKKDLLNYDLVAVTG